VDKLSVAKHVLARNRWLCDFLNCNQPYLEMKYRTLNLGVAELNWTRQKKRENKLAKNSVSLWSSHNPFYINLQSNYCVIWNTFNSRSIVDMKCYED